MKRIITIIIIVLFSISQYGCKQKQSNNISASNPSSSEESNGNTNYASESSDHPIHEIKLVKKPDKIGYIILNGIEIQYEEKSIKTSKGNVQGIFPRISGLKDKTVEENLNKTIIDDIQNQIKNYVDERNEISMFFSSVIELNASNLLSISLRDGESLPIYGLLYRLTDGKKLYLKDIFTEGTDYVPLLNNEIVEEILARQGEEENYLSEPFRTIKQDQNFVLSESNLYIVFHTGESGFLERTSISIPLSEIDDYVDVIDRYSGNEIKLQEKHDLMVKKNNIFTSKNGEIVKKSNGNVWCYYPKISGLRDTDFEALINKTIKEGIDEVVNSRYLDGLIKIKNQTSDYIALIDMSVSFNNYGLLCIRREVSTFDSSKNLQQFDRFYCFDLTKKKIVDSNDMVSSYIRNHKDLQEGFTMFIKKDLESKYSSNIDDFKNKVDNYVDYSFIMSKGQLSFSKYYPEDEMMIVVHFKGNTFKDIPYSLDCQVPFKSLIKGQPEDFFGL